VIWWRSITNATKSLFFEEIHRLISKAGMQNAERGYNTKTREGPGCWEEEVKAK
jgi:hypothetical protein